MYELTVNGEHIASGGTYGAARNVLIDYLHDRGNALAETVEFASDAECMVDYKEWHSDDTVAIIEYVEE